MIQSGRFKEAVAALYNLFLGNISDIDKISMCAELAGVYDRMGNTDDAIAWFEKGIDIERVYCRYEITEKKARYLSSLGRSKEAVPIYESLMKQPFVSESERDRMRKTIQTLIGEAMRQWK